MSEMHYFNVEVANRYGLPCAVLLQNIWHWVQKNKANDQNRFDGRYWTYNSVKAFAQLFPYLTDKQIRTTLKKLEDEGLIVTGNYNENKYDRTLWYSVTAKGEAIMNGEKTPENEEIALSESEKTTCPDTKIHFTKRANENARQGEPIPNINTDINTDRNQIEHETRAREDGFAEFWSQYPRKEGKAKAEAAWRRLKPSEATRADIMAALSRAKMTPQWSDDGGRYIPHASTWLNGRRWEDEPVQACKPVSELDRMLAEAAENGEGSEFLNAFFYG